MALYVPRAFACDDRRALDALIDEHPFATLVTPALPEPQVSHIPLLRDGDDALIGHFAGANPHGKHVAGVESLAIFHGPHAYVSPTWYAEPAQAVPTWNVATVHVRGRIELVTDAAQAQRIVETLAARFEGDGADAWKFTMAARQRDALIANIVAFRMPIASITGKHKLSQNRSADDRRRVIDALSRSPHADAQATAAWMRRFANPDD